MSLQNIQALEKQKQDLFAQSVENAAVLTDYRDVRVPATKTKITGFGRNPEQATQPDEKPGQPYAHVGDLKEQLRKEQETVIITTTRDASFKAKIADIQKLIDEEKSRLTPEEKKAYIDMISFEQAGNFAAKQTNLIVFGVVFIIVVVITVVVLTRRQLPV